MSEFYLDPFINLHNGNVVSYVQFCVVQKTLSESIFYFWESLIKL